MSTVQDKLNAPTELQSPSSSNITMTTTTEAQPTDQESESTCPKPVDATSSDAKEEPKDDANSVSKISDDDGSTSGTGDKAKRFLPAYKKANAALTFPEKVREQQRRIIVRLFSKRRVSFSRQHLFPSFFTPSTENRR